MSRTRVLRSILPVVAIALVAHLQAAPARDFIWKATARSGGALYLVGSVHLLSQDSYPLNPALETAFKDSDLLVAEADLGEMGMNAQMTFLSRGTLPSRPPRARLLPTATSALLTKHAGTSP